MARTIADAAALEGSWRGEASTVPDAEAAIELVRNELRPGDVVLVKASRAASLERVGLAIADDRIGTSETIRDDEGRRRRVGIKTILIAAVVGLVASILFTPLVVAFFRRRGFGQEIRVDGPKSHLVKRGTPTMGGVAIIGSTIAGYTAAHLSIAINGGGGPNASGVLLLFLMAGLGVVGLPRRPHQDPQPAQPRPARAGEVPGAAHRRRRASPCCACSSATSSG